MTSKFTIALIGLCAGSAAFSASAQDVGDPQKGQSFARMVCAECHAVDKAQERSPNPKAPAFASVANTSGMTELALRVWLQTSHPTMPNILLKDGDRNDVVAYIRSLKSSPR